MSLFITLLSLVASLTAQRWNSLGQSYLGNQDSVITCGHSEDVSVPVRIAITKFTVDIYKSIQAKSNGHFVTSTYSMWQSLAAIAEGSEGHAREELFKVLNLPEDECEREKYYKITATREVPNPEVTLARTRLLCVDESLVIDKHWENFARSFLLLNTSPAPIKRNPEEAAFLIRQLMSFQLPSLNFQGNSVLLDTLDYNGLWSEAFPDVTSVRAPFYNHLGQQIGAVDMMRGKKRVRMAYISQLDAKLLELRVGSDGRYRMMFGIPLGSKNITHSIGTASESVIFDVLENLRESLLPVEIAIPRFVMTTKLNARSILEGIGIGALWNDPLATRNISNPAAHPTSFIQRVTATMDAPGVKRPANTIRIPDEFDPLAGADIGLHPKLERDFIANRPFMFGFFDVETYTCLFVGAYSIPTYSLPDGNSLNEYSNGHR